LRKGGSSTATPILHEHGYATGMTCEHGPVSVASVSHTAVIRASAASKALEAARITSQGPAIAGVAKCHISDVRAEMPKIETYLVSYIDHTGTQSVIGNVYGRVIRSARDCSRPVECF
jgi:hypothetical protein